MNQSFIQIGAWERIETLPIEQAVTCTRIRLMLDGICVTEHEDNFAHTVREDVLLSAYPLAMWFATNWWRLLYEPRPTIGTVPTAWHISHEMPSANEGYVWPVVVFQSEGPSIAVTVPAQAGSKNNSLRYLNTYKRPFHITRKQLEKNLRSFITETVSRLAAMDVGETDLSRLWTEVQDEVRNPSDSAYRIIEACLGYDPDEAPPLLVEQLLDIRDQAGFDTVLEFAPTLFGNNDPQSLNIQDLISSAFTTPGILGRPSLPRLTEIPRFSALLAPWQQARRAALELREILSIGSNKLPTDTLCELLGVSLEALISAESPFGDIPVSLGIRRLDGHTRYYLRSIRRADDAVMHKSIRFQLARLIGDELIRSGSDQGWLACTESHTWRQAFQRAFAAEILCPPDIVEERFESPASALPDEIIEDVASQYEVSEMVVRNHVQNLQAAPDALPAAEK
jgi:hypothetical protein